MESDARTTFSAALRSAIRGSGLTLQAVRARLARRGVAVSVATLSSWQSGTNRPERPGSLHAVTELEDLFGLPPGALITLLGPRRPRGRRAGDQVGQPRNDLLPESDAVARIVQEISPEKFDGIRLLYVEENVRVGSDRTLREVRTRSVAEVLRDGVSRCFSLNYADSADDLDLVRTTAVDRCRLGRVRRDHDRRLIGAELLLERAYRSGEVFSIEYKTTTGQPVFDDEYFRAFTTPVTLYVLQVTFDQAMLPVRCHRFETPSWAHPRADREIDLVDRRTALVAARDAQPGMYGIRWEWT
ncbi:hypothetical protein FHS29_000383 [Saccharothrix tamanrassetensis]|uniref:Uncharacterized protein n=1 Tax=Saccharothrix tamanrassetensis TaxID=1051531 RepID=A0A841CA45_9PSEU|nr:hypothetical protein [Saccharothrix tamanrassetensis]MBB5953813.1 hypothetical protein [Saccharothrix tamanrassetensis]